MEQDTDILYGRHSRYRPEAESGDLRVRIRAELPDPRGPISGHAPAACLSFIICEGRYAGYRAEAIFTDDMVGEDFYYQMVNTFTGRFLPAATWKEKSGTAERLSGRGMREFSVLAEIDGIRDQGLYVKRFIRGTREAL